MHKTARSVDTLVVGGGLCGIAIARGLKNAGLEVAVAEKSLGIGGRVASRRHGGKNRFDYGLPAIDLDSIPETFRDDWRPIMSQLIPLPHSQRELVHPLGLKAFVQQLAEGLAVSLNQDISHFKLESNGQALRSISAGGSRLFSCRRVVLAMPAPQAEVLLAFTYPGHFPWITELLRSVNYLPTLTLVARIRSGEIPADGRWKNVRAPFDAVLENGARGLHDGRRVLTVHANEVFSSAHFGDSDAVLARLFRRALREQLGLEVEVLRVKRWRYARTERAVAAPFLSTLTRPEIVVAGDSFCGGGVSGALSSASATIAHILSHPCEWKPRREFRNFSAAGRLKDSV